MNCPVCHTALTGSRCPVCGFDRSKHYERCLTPGLRFDGTILCAASGEYGQCSAEPLLRE